LNERRAAVADTSHGDLDLAQPEDLYLFCIDLNPIEKI